jgi:hypothetical protein
MELLDAHGLLSETQVGQWVRKSGNAPLLAKNRITEQAWLRYADSHCAEE